MIKLSREEEFRRGFRTLAHKCFAVSGVGALCMAAQQAEVAAFGGIDGAPILTLPFVLVLPFAAFAALMAVGCAVNLYNDVTVAPLGVLTLVLVGALSNMELERAEVSVLFLGYGVVVLAVALRELVRW